LTHNSVPSPTRVNLTSAVLVAVCIAAAFRELGASGWPAVVAGTILPLFIAIEWSRLAGIARLLVGAALATFIYFYSQGQISIELLESAFNRSAFFTFFVISLDVLRNAAQTSPLIRRCGKLIISQPPGRRYTVLTMGGHLFGVLLNMGSINLLGTMIRRSIDTGQDGVEERIREIRLQRMSLAMYRGFSCVPLWAPTSVCVAIVVIGLPDITWLDIAPMGFAAAMVYLIFGWVLDRLSFPRAQMRVKPQGFLSVLAALAPLLVLNFLILGPTFVVSQILSLRLISAMLICVPVFGAIWIILQYSRAGYGVAVALTARRFRRRTFPGFSDYRSEIAILASSGFLAVILPPQIDIAALGAAITQLGLSGGQVLALSAWAIFLISPTGLNPIITVSLAIELLPQIPGLDISTHMIALMAMAAWCVVTGFSPMVAATRLMSRCIQKTPYELGIKWNGVFCICLLIGLSFFFLIFV